MALSYRGSTHSIVQSQWIRRSTLNKHNNSGKKSELTSKQAKPRGPIRRDTKEVLAELVGKLKEKLDPKKLAATSAGEKPRPKRGELRPNPDRLTATVKTLPDAR